MTSTTLLPYIIFLAILVFSFLMTWLLTENHRLFVQNRNLQSRIEIMYRNIGNFIKKLESEADIYDTLNNIAQQIREDLGAEDIGIFVPDISSSAEHPRLHGASCTGTFPVLTQPAKTPSFINVEERNKFFRTETISPDTPSFLGDAFRERKIILRNLDEIKLAEYPLPSNVKCLLILPLIFGESFTGLIVAVNRSRRKKNHFSEEDCELLQKLSPIASIAASLVKGYGERDRQLRILTEMKLSSELMKKLLPIPDGQEEQLPYFLEHKGHFHFAARNIPCYEVSGDFYDFVCLNDGRYLALVADATGKGFSGCLLAAICHSFVQLLAERFTYLNEFMLDLNRLIFANSSLYQNLTAAAVVIDPAQKTVEITSAGHPPVLLSRADGSFESINLQGDAVGMWPNDEDPMFNTKTIQLNDGDKLCIYTDGIIEAQALNQELYGQERLEQLWQEHAPSSQQPLDLVDRILEDVNAFTAGAEQSDDQTIFVISAS